MELSLAFQPALMLSSSQLHVVCNRHTPRPVTVTVSPETRRLPARQRGRGRARGRPASPSLAQTFPKPNAPTPPYSHDDGTNPISPTATSASAWSASSGTNSTPTTISPPISTSTHRSFPSSSSDVAQVHKYPLPAGTSDTFSTLARGANTIPDLFHRLSEHPTLASSIALIDPHSGTEVETLTHGAYAARVRSFTRALGSLGLSSGDVVSLFSENSARWGVCDLSIMSCGACAAVRGSSAPAQELAYILEHSTSKGLFVENVATLRHLLSACSEDVEKEKTIARLKFIVVLFGSSTEASAALTYTGNKPPVLSFDQVLRIGKSLKPEQGDTALDIPANRDSMATMLYTSGTTGNPKGVVLTHENILRQLEHISLGAYDPSPGDVFVSILPCWHVFERTAAYWCLSRGMTLVYSNKRHFKNDLTKYKPHILIAVPRVFENLHATIFSKLRSAPALRRGIFSLFASLSLMYVRSRRVVSGVLINTGSINIGMKLLSMIRMILLWPLWALAHMLIWKKIRAGLGNRISICLSGGGSIATYLEDFFECANIPICVGYGLTETSPVIANRFSQHNVRGTTGMPLKSTTVKLVNQETGSRVLETGVQGVLHVSGPSVFKEYFLNEKATKQAFDEEGFFNTGDIAYYADGGDIVICGRSKDVIVLNNGENIEPTAIEDAVQGSGYIDQIMLVGQDRKALGALVVPNYDQLATDGVLTVDEAQSLKKGAREGGEKEAKNVVECIAGEIKERNQGRKAYCASDNITHVVIVDAFSVENGMMTQTLKLKKDVIAKRYASTITAMYEHQ